MQTIPDVLRRAERIFPGDEALVCGEVRRTTRQLLDRVHRVGGLLGQLGVGSGERVALLLGNGTAFLDLYLGVPSAGRVVVPLNFRWSEPELAYAIEDAGTRVLVTDRDPGRLADLVDRVVRTDTDDYESLLAAAPAAPFDPTLAADTVVGLFYTGGTTGASKGVMLTHGNLLANALGMQLLVPLERSDTFLVIAPMFHAAGSISILQCLMTGVTQVVAPVFDPALILELVETERATVTVVVPTMAAAIVEEQLARPREVSTLRVLIHGGSPIATEVVRRGTEALPETEWVHVYGATETSPLVTGLRREHLHLEGPRSRSCGQAAIGVEVVIRDPDGNPLPDGEVGEVTVRGANVMAGYWNKPDATAAAIRDGWYRTGDIGSMDAEGYVVLLDRAKDMIISGGENVYCVEVEEALYQHPSVLEAAVFGVPDERWGEAVHAVVVPRAPVEADELVAFCRERIAHYKVPRSISFQDEPLPKSGPGKVLKRELRAPYWEGRESAIN